MLVVADSEGDGVESEDILDSSRDMFSMFALISADEPLGPC